MAAAANVVIFGASGTLGRAIARAVAARGARLGLTYHRGEAAVVSLAAELPGAVARRLDLTVTADIPRVLDELAAELGTIDAFVHAAGIGSTLSPPAYEHLGDTKEPGWD